MTTITAIQCDNELAREEVLDAIDPLRHLMHVDDDDDSEAKSPSVELLPAQNSTTVKQIQHMSFSHAYDNGTRTIDIALEVDAMPGCGGIAWPAGQVLSEYLVRKYPSLKDRVIVELGSGTGLVGLVAAKLGGTVYVTDQAPLLPIMKTNAKINYLSNVTVEELNWGEPIPHHIAARPDMVLAADCVYFEPAFPLLVQTLCDLSDSKTEILFCYKKRRKADKRFFNLLKKRMHYTEVEDEPYRQSYSHDAISLLKFSKISAEVDSSHLLSV